MIVHLVSMPRSSVMKLIYCKFTTSSEETLMKNNGAKKSNYEELRHIIRLWLSKLVGHGLDPKFTVIIKLIFFPDRWILALAHYLSKGHEMTTGKMQPTLFLSHRLSLNKSFIRLLNNFLIDFINKRNL